MRSPTINLKQTATASLNELNTTKEVSDTNLASGYIVEVMTKLKYQSKASSLNQAATDVIFVLGMHRSGTSVLTSCVNAAGASMSENLVGAVPCNPHGLFEDHDVINLNSLIFQHLSMHWADPGVMPKEWNKKSEIVSLLPAAIKVLENSKTSTSPLVLKDPRFCRTLPFWLEASNVLSYTTKFLITVRHPWEVAKSLNLRDSFSFDKSYALWARHICEAETATRSYQRLFVLYEDLLADPYAELSKVNDVLEFGLLKHLEDEAKVRSAVVKSTRTNKATNSLEDEEALPEIVDSIWEKFNQPMFEDDENFQQLFDKINDKCSEAPFPFNAQIAEMSRELDWRFKEILKRDAQIAESNSSLEEWVNQHQA